MIDKIISANEIKEQVNDNYHRNDEMHELLIEITQKLINDSKFGYDTVTFDFNNSKYSLKLDKILINKMTTELENLGYFVKSGLMDSIIEYYYIKVSLTPFEVVKDPWYIRLFF